MSIVNIKDKKNTLQSEKIMKNDYLTDLYPSNYFNFHLDIGARGIVNPWHLHFLSEKSPETIHIGYECDIPYYEEIKTIIEDNEISNAKIYSEPFGDGKTVTTPQGEFKSIRLNEIVDRDALNIDDNWCFKIDCEGCEYSLFGDSESEEILKKANHLAIETHFGSVVERTNNFWHRVNEYPTESIVESWLNDVFSETHKIFMTDDDSRGLGLKTHVLISNETYDDMNNLFWKDVL